MNGLSVLRITVDLVIFACLNSREFQILGLFTKFRIREFAFFYSRAMIIIIFTTFLNLFSSQNQKPREYYQIYSMFEVSQFY